VQTAVRYKVPLIIWGAHQGLEQVGMFSHEHEAEMTRRYRKDHDLFAKEPDDLLSMFDTLREEDIWQYRYPEDSALNAVGVRGIYLGNYVRWDPKAQHEKMIASKGYRTTTFERTFDCYDHVDCFNYMGLHDLIKLYKHGYSKVTDHASREIRFGRLSRDQGLALVNEHEQIAPKHVDLFCEWLGITPKSLQFILDQHRNKKFWYEEAPGQWVFRGWSTLNESGQGTNPSVMEEFAFSATEQSTSSSSSSSRYITIGKGFP